MGNSFHPSTPLNTYWISCQEQNANIYRGRRTRRWFRRDGSGVPHCRDGSYALSRFSLTSPLGGRAARGTAPMRLEAVERGPGRYLIAVGTEDQIDHGLLRLRSLAGAQQAGRVGGAIRARPRRQGCLPAVYFFFLAFASGFGAMANVRP